MTRAQDERPEGHKRREAEDEVPPRPVVARRGTQGNAGANTPTGPFPDDTSAPMKQAREHREAKEKEDLEQGERD